MYEPEHLQSWQSWEPTQFDSAANRDFTKDPGFYVAPVIQTRDSGCLEKSNFRVVLADLENICKDSPDKPEIEVHRFGHWGPGWYEIILIPAKNEPALKAADEWSAALSDYPVASDSDYSELEWETAAEYWAQESLRQRIYICNRFNVSIFAARREEIPEDSTGEIISYLAE